MQLSNQTVRRLFRMELPELVYRGKQETFKLVERVRSMSTATRFETNRTRLSRFVENAKKHFFEGALDAAMRETLTTSKIDDCQEVLIAADHATRGSFDLLGYRGLQFGEPIDWHLDPVSGKRAPFVHWSRLDPLDRAAVGDSKVVWELNRHQWLVHLAQAWRITGDERFAQTIVNSMRAWLQMNEPGMGINWTSSLEAALRIISWSWAMVLIRDSRTLTADVFCQLEDAIEAHATHVEKYLSYYFSPNTHLTGEALGLFYASVVFPQLKRADRWRSLALRILTAEVERQVLSDGVYFERSTCYQRYTADIYLHLVILAGRAGIKLPPAIARSLQAVLDALVALRQPDGSMPSIGDADGGALLPLSKTAADDFRATFSTAAVVFSDPVYAWAAGDVSCETLWLLGTRAADSFRDMGKMQPTSGNHRVFAAGGFAVMRSGWDEKAHSMIFDGGPLGCHFSAGHGHADLLSIQCSVFGQPFLADAGTGCYTGDPEMREYFRGTAAHSCVMIDGKPQAQPDGPFSWQGRCDAQLLQWRFDDSLASVDAIHHAYRGLADPVTHRRRVVFVKSRYWIVLDDLCGSESHRVDVRFQFAPMEIRIQDEGWVRASRDNQHALLLRAFTSAPFDVSVREGQRAPMEGWVSPDYGRIQPAPAVVYTATTKLPLRVMTLLWPSDDIDEVPVVEAILDSRGRPTGLTVRDRNETITFDDDDVSLES